MSSSLFVGSPCSSVCVLVGAHKRTRSPEPLDQQHAQQRNKNFNNQHNQNETHTTITKQENSDQLNSTDACCADGDCLPAAPHLISVGGLEVDESQAASAVVASSSSGVVAPTACAPPCVVEDAVDSIRDSMVAPSSTAAQQTDSHPHANIKQQTQSIIKSPTHQQTISTDIDGDDDEEIAQEVNKELLDTGDGVVSPSCVVACCSPSGLASSSPFGRRVRMPHGPELNGLSKLPYQVLQVPLPWQHAVSRNESKHLSEEQKHMIVQRPVRVMLCSSPATGPDPHGRLQLTAANIWFVAKDVAQLLHIHEANVARRIANFQPNERARMPVQCLQSNGTKATLLLSVLSCEGMTRLLLGSKKAIMGPRLHKFLSNYVQTLCTNPPHISAVIRDPLSTTVMHPPAQPVFYPSEVANHYSNRSLTSYNPNLALNLHSQSPYQSVHSPVLSSPVQQAGGSGWAAAPYNSQAAHYYKSPYVNNPAINPSHGLLGGAPNTGVAFPHDPKSDYSSVSSPYHSYSGVANVVWNPSRASFPAAGGPSFHRSHQPVTLTPNTPSNASHSNAMLNSLAFPGGQASPLQQLANTFAYNPATYSTGATPYAHFNQYYNYKSLPGVKPIIINNAAQHVQH